MKALEAVVRILAMLAFFILAAVLFGVALETMENFHRLPAYIFFGLSGIMAGAGFLVGCTQPKKS